MIILGIETSCDETAAAVLEQKTERIQILSNVVASSASLQTKYGGIIPEQAAREQVKSIIPVIEEALTQAFPNYSLQPTHYDLPIDAIAVTYGPGLIGSLLVGVETAKVLAKIWNKPLIPVNHLLGHFWANWINNSISIIDYRTSERQHDKRLTINDMPIFPCLGLLVSGGHTDLVLFTDHDKYQYLGGTRDDAAGECFDKCARLLNLPYPGGPEISKLAQKGDPNKFKLPIPMQNKGLDFSYSGLKTSVSNIVHGLSENKNNIRLTINDKQNLATSIEETIIKSLVNKVVLAIQKYSVEQIIVAGGVAANQKLTKELGTRCKELGVKLHVPPPYLCTDNGAMIAARAFFEKPIDLLKVQANPNLNLG